MKTWLLAAALPVALAACETTVSKPSYPEIAYDHLVPIRLDVARVEVERAYRLPAKKPNVEHLFPVSPLAAAERWGRDRLRPAGADGVVRVVVKRASVVEVPLKRTKGVRGMFTTDQTERYDGVMEISVQILDGAGRERGMVSSRTERSRSVAENISLNGRKMVWYEMTQAMMNDLNTALERQIRERLTQYVR